MKYTDTTFSVGVGSAAYRDGWERIFGKGAQPSPCEPTPAEGFAKPEGEVLEVTCNACGDVFWVIPPMGDLERALFECAECQALDAEEWPL